MPSSTERLPPSRREALRFWWLLGWISFGGPAGQIAILHRELVERRRWIAAADFTHALNICMLLPGPEAMQLATWAGWRLHGLRGGLLAGALFVLPASVLLALLAWLYLRYGQLPVMAGALLGIQAAVLALVLQAVLRLGRKVLADASAVAIAVLSFLALTLLRWPFPAVIAAAGVIAFLLQRLRPQERVATISTEKGASSTPLWRHSLRVATALALAWWLPLLAVRLWLGEDSTAWTMATFFSKAALVTVGGAYAVLPYVAQQAVETHQWLQPEQMLVGLGLAESTPGPLIMVLEFVGFVGGWQRPDFASPLASALLGAAVTVWATFLPSFLMVLSVAPWLDRLHTATWLTAALRGVTAAVVGTIASLALWFGVHLLGPSPLAQRGVVVAIALASGIALQRGIATGWIVLAAAAIGAFASVLL